MTSTTRNNAIETPIMAEVGNEAVRPMDAQGNELKKLILI